jgi:hypothetical protein
MPGKGRPFPKGVSGNPGGRPKVLGDVQELARQHTTTAVETFVSIMTNSKAPPAARVSAANALLDRGYGKASQHITGEGRSDFIHFIEVPETLSSEDWQKKYGRLSVCGPR